MYFINLIVWFVDTKSHGSKCKMNYSLKVSNYPAKAVAEEEIRFSKRAKTNETRAVDYYF